MSYMIGVDVGGSLLRAACFDDEFNLIARAEKRTKAKKGSDVVLGRLFETIRQVLPDNRDNLKGIGLALPGPIDPQAGVLIAPPNLPFRDIPIVSLAEEALGHTVFIGNDADMAGLAEYHFGAGKGTRSMVYMTISTGIGAGLILDGKLHIGRGQGGEIGHMVVEPSGPICPCGKPGHLEAVASGPSIARIVRQRLEAGEQSAKLRELVQDDLSLLDARIIGEAAWAGDALSLEVITQAGRYIGMGIASLMVVLNPDIFVLGGGVTKLGDMLFDPINEAVREYAMHPDFWENTPIVRAELGGDVGLYGAAALVQMRLEG